MGQQGLVVTQRLGLDQQGRKVETGDTATRADADGADGPDQQFPGLPARLGQWGVAVVGAVAVSAAASAVFRPAAEVPFGAGLETFPSAMTAS